MINWFKNHLFNNINRFINLQEVKNFDRDG